MNISISESGSVSMSMNIDFRLYAKFRNEQICTDTLSKITVIYDEDEECSLLDIAKAFRTSELMTLLSKHDPMVYAFDTVTAPEGESFCFVHNVYGSEQEALLALAVFGRAIIELAEDDVALIIDMTDYDNEYFGDHIMYYLGGELDEVKQYTVRGVAGSSHHGIEISDFNKMLKDAGLSPAQKRYLKEIAPEPHPTDLMDSMKWWTKKKQSEKKKTTSQTKKNPTKSNNNNSNRNSDTPEMLEAKKEAALKRGFLALEDGEWDKADGFFEILLGYDAESSKAYLGRFLADNKTDSLQSYENECLKQIDYTVKKMLSSEKEQSGKYYKTITACDADESFIEDVITQYSVKEGNEELKPSKIKQEFDYDRTYVTIIDAIETYKKRTLTELKDDKNLIKAKRYGDEELLQSIQQLEDNIIKKFDRYISKESKKNKERDKQIPVLYREHLNSVALNIKQRKERWDEEQAKKYAVLKNKAESIINGTEPYDEDKTNITAVELDRMHGYAESKQLAETLFNEIKFKRSLEYFSNSSSLEQYTVALDMFSKIETYKDSPEYIKKCNKAISELKAEREEKEKAEQKRLRRKKRRKTVLVCAILILVVMAVSAYFVYTKVIYPAERYDHGIEELEAGNYDEAVEIFEKLGDYKDSSKMVDESKYQKALSMFDSRKYDEAIEIFTQLADYKDSKNKVDESKYEIAMNLYEAGKTYDSYVLFGQIESFKDAASIRQKIIDGAISDIDKCVSEDRYDDAKNIIAEYSLDDIYTEDYIDFLEGKKLFESAIIVDEKIEINKEMLERAIKLFTRNNYVDADKYYSACDVILDLKDKHIKISELSDYSSIPQCKEIYNRITEVIDGFKGTLYSDQTDDSRFYVEIKGFSNDGSVKRYYYTYDYINKYYGKSEHDYYMFFMIKDGYIKLDKIDTDDWKDDGYTYYEQYDCFLEDMYADYYGDYNDSLEFAAIKRVN